MLQVFHTNVAKVDLDVAMLTDGESCCFPWPRVRRGCGRASRRPPLLPGAAMNGCRGTGGSSNRCRCMLQEYVLGIPEVLGNVASVSCRCCESKSRYCNVAKVDLDVADVVFECWDVIF
jgi:hypothetical protein